MVLGRAATSALSCEVSQSDVLKPVAAPQNLTFEDELYRLMKKEAVRDDRVELTVLTTGIHARLGEFMSRLTIKLSTKVLLSDDPFFDGDDPRFKTEPPPLFKQRESVFLP